MCHVSHVTCQVSCVMCHMSHVTFHMTHVTPCVMCQMQKKSMSMEGLLSTGPTLSSLDRYTHKSAAIEIDIPKGVTTYFEERRRKKIKLLSMVGET